MMGHSTPRLLAVLVQLLVRWVVLLAGQILNLKDRVIQQKLAFLLLFWREHGRFLIALNFSSAR